MKEDAAHLAAIAAAIAAAIEGRSDGSDQPGPKTARLSGDAGRTEGHIGAPARAACARSGADARLPMLAAAMRDVASNEAQDVVAEYAAQNRREPGRERPRPPSAQLPAEQRPQLGRVHELRGRGRCVEGYGAAHRLAGVEVGGR